MAAIQTLPSAGALFKIETCKKNIQRTAGISGIKPEVMAASSSCCSVLPAKKKNAYVSHKSLNWFMLDGCPVHPYAHFTTATSEGAP